MGCAPVAAESGATGTPGTTGPGEKPDRPPTQPAPTAHTDRPPDVPIGDFGAGAWDRWENVGFNFWTPKVTYRQGRGPGGAVAIAESRGAASILVRRVRIDIERYPVVRWTWKVAGLIPRADVSRKSSDDAPARVYFAWSVERPADIFKAKALTYVWGKGQRIGEFGPSPYTAQEGVVVLRSATGVGSWAEEERNLPADYRRFFGSAPPGPVTALALMADTDQTGAQAAAWYGTIEALPAASGRSN